MKILITGSSGFIGFHLSKRLLLLNHKVTGIDNHNDHYDINLKEHRKDQLKSKNFKFFKKNLNELSSIKEEFDLAINLAAQPGVRIAKEKEYLYKKNNIEGFESFCDFCLKRNIEHVIYASSSSVYEDIKLKKFSESKSKLLPKSKYGKSKLCNEQYAEKVRRENCIKIIGLRFFSVYGPMGRPDMAYYSFTESIKNDEPVILFNNGEMSRDMTYIDDIIDGIIASIEYVLKIKKTSTHEIFNLGNNKPISTLNVLNKINNKFNKKLKIIRKDTNNEALYTHACIEKAKTVLGYNPKVNFDEGMNLFLKWHEKYGK